MAMFPTHIKCSTATGIIGGIVACVGYGVPLTTSAVGAGLCAIGGILPDIDSGPGIPLREITTFLASAVPTMLITRLLSYNLNQEMLILAGAVIYIGIRFGLSHFLRQYTVHRGMFHSFPSMAIFGEITYLLFYGESMFVREFMVSAVCLGFFIHLLLDEIYSVEWDGKPRLKKSFGTAMKFTGEHWWANATCYGKLAICTYFVLIDPNVVHQISAGQGQQVAQNLGDTMKERLDTAKNAIGAKTSGKGGLAALLGSFSTTPTTGVTPAAGSSAVAPPGVAWPAAGTAPVAVGNGYAAPQPAAYAVPANQAAANWSTPANPPASNGNYGSAPNPAPAANGYYSPAGNQSSATPAPAQPRAPGRFW